MFLSLGEALIDLIPPSNADPRNASALTIQPGGAPLNVAIALRRLGVPVMFVGSISTDAFGDRLSDLLVVEGIKRIPVGRADAQTRLAVVDHSAPSDASFRFYGRDTADTILSRQDVDDVFSSELSGLYVTSLLLGSKPAADAQSYAIERAIARGLPVFTDPNPRPPAWNDRADMVNAVRSQLANSHYAKLSLLDTHALGWDASPDELIGTLEADTPAQIIVTDGERGCWAQLDGEIVHVEAPRVTPVDPTGAGDAFFGALIASVLADGRLTIGGLQKASAAGALATTVQGAVVSIPSRRKLERSMAEGIPANEY